MENPVICPTLQIETDRLTGCFMSINDPIAYLESKMELAYQAGDYQKAKLLENKLRHIRGQHHQSTYLQDDPYSLEGRSFLDD